MHLNSILKNPTTGRSEDLVEFASIYFEEYAKNKIKTKEKQRLKLNVNVKKCITTVILALLVLILLFQIQ